MTRLILVPREGVDGRRALENVTPSGSLDPVEPSSKVWRFGNFVWLALSYGIQPQAYMYGLIGLWMGLSWQWILVAAFISSLFAACFGAAVAHPTSKYGVPVSVVMRSSFGVVGSKIYSLLYLLLALPWASFLLSIAVEGLSKGIYKMKSSSETWSPLPAGLLPPGYTFVALLCIIGLTLLMMMWFLPGDAAFSLCNSASSASSTALGFYIGLAIWGCRLVGLSTSLEMYERLQNPDRSSLPLRLSLPITILAGLGCFSTLSLSYGDMARWAERRSAPKSAFLIAFPIAVTSTTLLGMIVTGAVERGWTSESLTPTSNLKYLSPPVMALATGIFLAISILHTVLAGYTLSAAHCIADLVPTYLTAKSGGAFFILATLIFTLFSPSTFAYNVFNPSASGRLSLPWWSQTCGLISGGIFGILIADYFIIRQRELPTDYLYRLSPRLHWLGVNIGAIVALLIAYSIFIIKPMMGIDWAPMGGPELLPALCFLPTFLLSMFVYVLTYKCFSSPPIPIRAEPSTRSSSQERAAAVVPLPSQQSASERATQKLTATLHQLLNNPYPPAQPAQPSAPPADDIEGSYGRRHSTSSDISSSSRSRRDPDYSIPPSSRRSPPKRAREKGVDGRRSSRGEETKEIQSGVPYAHAVPIYDD